MAIRGKKTRLSRRARVKLRIRKRVRGSDERPRLSVFKSSKNTYAQIISDESRRTLASASTLEKAVLSELENAAFARGDKPPVKDGAAAVRAKSRKSVLAAEIVGAMVAKRALERNIKQVVFDRGGFVYHGRVRAVAEGARKAGLKF